MKVQLHQSMVDPNRYSFGASLDTPLLGDVVCRDCKDNDMLPEYVWRGVGSLLTVLAAVTRHEETTHRAVKV